MSAWKEEPKEEKFKRSKRASRPANEEEQNHRDTSDTVPDAVIHCVVEAIESSADYVISRSDVPAMIEEGGKTPKEVFQKLLDEDKVEVILAVASVSVLSDVHDAIHQAMRGDGIKDLKNKELKQAVYEWYHSDEFKEKYKASPPEAIEEALGA